ncbi:hypothetical protein BGM19_21480 [Streptomyces agglomeratus]|uniref:DUF3558 domain-containing protein n=1 Tax=Streptomyces agglomeratus TaxID=285458 RepID=A0A1E5P878_9ACTN|nr:hypothetical protein [Streptomyces agglomeratus]OEJ25667.1 hypothetical protein AS594_15330 [Streptomyces agglomeratus]OEJ52843.1 hypothetical protein BGK72_20780 [Streptomyces agglomeratus]OEJ60179.1 hypothetical protein BGM19_21480 [Streptomyces agglomeratus]
MQRKVYVTGVALLAALTAGCTGGSGTDGSTADAKAGEANTSVAAPGKYRTLREPCGSVDRGILRDLLPGAATLPEEQQEKAYDGTAAVTYDTDRRVGCKWKVDSPAATHHLLVDFERVVSYDADVSDDDRAEEVFAKQETAADLPAPTRSPDADPDEGADPDDGGATEDGEGDSSASPGSGSSDDPPTAPPSKAAGKPGGDSTTATPDSSADSATEGPTGGASDSATGAGGNSGAVAQAPEGLEPRTLAGLGDAAFLDDALVRSGSTAQRRTVSVVFRTSNVIVTVQYSEQPTTTNDLPDSKELQEKTQALARRLAEQFSD